MAARGEGRWGILGEKVKGLRSTNWLLQNSHGDVRYSIGNTANDIVVTMCGGRWALGVSGGPLCKVQYIII